MSTMCVIVSIVFALLCFALQADRDTLVHMSCSGIHIPAALMLQAQRKQKQQLCRYLFRKLIWLSGFSGSLCLGNVHRHLESVWTLLLCVCAY